MCHQFVTQDASGYETGYVAKSVPETTDPGCAPLWGRAVPQNPFAGYKIVRMRTLLAGFRKAAWFHATQFDFLLTPAGPQAGKRLR